jgi:ABC-2 type transport system permease protein
MIDFYLFKTALRDLTRPKRLIAALILIAIPSALALMLRWGARRGSDDFYPQAVYNALAPAMVFGFILVILAVIFATGVVSQEVEQKTIVYLLTRPVPRWRILLMRFLAAIVAISVTGWLAAGLLAFVLLGGSALSDSTLQRDLTIIPIAALAYGSAFLLLATLLAKPLLWGLLYAFGVESWAPNLPGIQKISLMAYLRVLAPHTQMERESVDIREFLTVMNPGTITNTTAWTVLTLVIGLSLCAALFIFSVNEYVPREDAE